VFATYWATLGVCAFSLGVGQAALALCGVRRLSWLSPAVGLALLCALSWGTVRLPGGGMTTVFGVLAVLAAAVVVLRGRLNDGATREDLIVGSAVAALALLAASLPFLVEGHFGILGTGFNPDMSQHLLTTDLLARGDGSELLGQGYPLGPHSIVVGLDEGAGVGLVQGFDGLTVAVAIIAALAASVAFAELPRPHRIAGALVVGLAYMVASYFAQGSFKETMQALFVLAFVLALREAARNPVWRDAPLRFVPAALIAVGSAYAYSYPGPVWLAAAALAWIGIGLVRDHVALPGPAPWRAAGLALLAFGVLAAPEVGRMVEFHNFETFDPNGPGLGNLFAPISPFEALGIWPSGDFRLSPGDGAVPALGYYLGAAFASILLLYGVVVCWRRRETAILAGLLAVVALYAAASLAGTPYTMAKAIGVAAPIAALAILLPLLRRPVGIAYALAAGGCALLALANAPVGPTEYSPALTGLRPLVADGSTLVLASERLLDKEQGERYIVWELRGGRVCVGRESDAGRVSGQGDVKGDTRAVPAAKRPPTGVGFVVTEDGVRRPPFAGLRLRRDADPYLLWETTSAPRGQSACPLIAVRQARQGPAG
jgi:hypothetical protein